MSGSVDFYEQLAVWSQVFGSFAFIVFLVYAFQRFLVPAIAASQERKNAELIEAERRRDAAKEDAAAAARELQSVEEEVRGLRARAAVDSRKERERILAVATADGKRLVTVAEGELTRVRSAAREAFRASLLDRALDVARSSAQQAVDAQTDRALVSGVMNVAARGNAAVAEPARV